ncbi:sialate:O-sulfotransferase 1-like [Ptychodera flava]|uniref:sialate:O-sulfotransferase 1-like n=1 Tax=Ptychodera flava TaxID=63121 RepID=UPI00396A286F
MPAVRCCRRRVQAALTAAVFMCALFLMVNLIDDAVQMDEEYETIDFTRPRGIIIKVTPPALPNPFPEIIHENDPSGLDNKQRRYVNCDVYFADSSSRPLVALASFPGSGNTWLRYLLERYIGIYTGSFYTDGDLANAGFRGESRYWKRRDMLVVKVHETGDDAISEFDGAVLLLRNPFDAIVSERHRQSGGGHIKIAGKEAFQGTGWESMVQDYASYWEVLATKWLESGLPVLVVHYEKVKTDTLGELSRIADFLNVSVADRRPECILPDSGNQFRRDAKAARFPSDPFTPALHDIIDKKIRIVNFILREEGAPTVVPQNDHFAQSLRHDTSSDPTNRS